MASKSEQFDSLLVSVRDSRLPSPATRRRIRESAEVTIREAAEALGVAPMTYIRWERGDVRLRRAHALDYRAFLDALSEASA
ncbi:MAG: helix-turn-helix domain-containing protein [Acidimicrobiales bacterium]|jgi:DNA-binding XRE family transcriptional regulator